MRSLRTLMALGLLLAVTVPAAAAAGAWVGVGAWQAHRLAARRDAAAQVIKLGPRDTKTLLDKLSALGVEASLSPSKGAEADPVLAKQLKLSGQPEVHTQGLDTILTAPNGKQQLGKRYEILGIDLPDVSGQIFIRRESSTPRWALTIAAGALGLAAALALAVALLNRWVLRPLAGLAADADRIAGGEVAVEPVRTRVREVDQVGEAMRGMAGALQGAVETSQAAEVERRFLVSAIAHDLRTPLFTLRGSLEALERGIGRDELARAQRKAAHLDRLVDDLFAFARADYAHSGEEVDLAEIARRAAETVDPGEKALDVAAPAPVRAHGDPVALQRVLTNLLDNAIRHARTRVEMTVEAGGGAARVNGTGRAGAVVVVADDGPGFSPADLPRVFEPLYRGDQARRGGGAGLGLAIARRLARAHGGDVEAANADGARVTLTLPPVPARADAGARLAPPAHPRA